MRAPGFWYRPKGLAARLLAPLGALYAAATARRLRRGPRARLNVPVVCIGNINAGGTGKTPSVIAIAERLKARGVAAHVVSRGYGGRIEGPHRVTEREDSAEDVGDEPLLLSAFLPVWVARDRLAGARAASEAGAELILLDDGFQNPALAYDLSLVVVDAARGFGNGSVIPAGPLREPVGVGLERADMVLSIGGAKAQEEFARRWGQMIELPHLKGALKPLPTGMPFAGLPVLGFAGIGYPQKFFATLRNMGAEIRGAEALADHQPLTETLMARLEREAAALGAQLVTTEKDAVRLPESFRRKVLTVPVRLEIEDWSALDVAFDRLLKAG